MSVSVTVTVPPLVVVLYEVLVLVVVSDWLVPVVAVPVCVYDVVLLDTEEVVL